MKKLVSLFLCVFSALIIFNLCFFVCVDYGGNEGAWLCYLFFHFAYALTLLTPFFVTRRKLGVLNNMLYTISFIYLLIVAITSVILLAIKDVVIETVVFIYSVELMIYLAYFHYCHLINRKVEKGVIKGLKRASKHNTWIAELRVLAKLSDDGEKAKILHSFIGEIMSSPSSSNLYVHKVDNDIQTQINALRLYFEDMSMEELAEYKRQIVYDIKKRTKILKYSNTKI